MTESLEQIGSGKIEKEKESLICYTNQMFHFIREKPPLSPQTMSLSFDPGAFR